MALGKQASFCNPLDWMDKYSALFAHGGLSLDRLRTLCRVAEAGSLTAAAGGNTTRVSLYSRQIKELESFFGARLVRRRGQRIALTRTGEDLVQLVRRYFFELNEFLNRCAGAPPELVFGAGASVMEWLVMPRMAALRRALPRVQLSLLRQSSEELARRLAEMRLDLGILRTSAAGPTLRTQEFATFRYALYVPRALAGPARSLARWLPQTPLIAPIEGWTRTRIDKALAASGLRLRFAVRAASATLAVRAVRSGDYAAILPDVAAPELAEVDVAVFHPQFLKRIERKLCLAWHPRVLEARPALQRAIDVIASWRTEIRR